MKLKGNSALSVKKAGSISFLLFFLLFAVRLYQSFALTDGKTGFFTSDNFTVTLMYILAAASVFVPLVMLYISKELPAGDMKKKPSLIYVLSSVLFAFSLVWDGVKTVKTFLSAGGGIEAQKEAIGGNAGIVAMVFAFLGGLAVIISLFVYMKSGSLTGKMKIPMLFPVIWAFVKCLGFFSITISYVKVGQLLLSIFSVAFLMVFLFENARVLTGIGRKEALWFFFATGMITAGLSLASGVPNMLISLFAPEKSVSYAPFELYSIAGGLYALASILSRDNEEEKPEDDESEEVILIEDDGDNIAEAENNNLTES